jgi:quercetin dioxygenase-like cupin family protein
MEIAARQAASFAKDTARQRALALQSRNRRHTRKFLQFAFEKGFLAGMRFIICAVIAAVTFIVPTSPVWAQDPVAVNKTVKVKFENERVRVLEAELPPGVKEQVHSHPAYVIYVLAGGKVRNYAADGKTTEAELKTGDVLYREPLTHAAENIGTTTMHFILVELKTAPSP